MTCAPPDNSAARARHERGAVLVEAAFVYPLLFLVIFGLVEFGLAFRDYLSVSNAARDGALTGAIYGNNARADMLILEAVHESLAMIGLSDHVRVRVYDPADESATETVYTYEEGYGDGCNWNPCPDPDRSTPPYEVPNWSPATRDVTAPDTDRIAVEVSFDHQWVTNYVLDDATFTVVADYQIEPQLFGSDGS